MGVRLIAPLPMARAQYAQDFDDAAARARFDALCDCGGNHRSAGGRRQRALARAVAVRPGTSAICTTRRPVYTFPVIATSCWRSGTARRRDRLGGTAQVVRFHLTGIKPAAERTPPQCGAQRVLGNDSERLAYHIVCSRDEADGAPAPPLEPLQTFWRVGERAVAGRRADAGRIPHDVRAHRRIQRRLRHVFRADRARTRARRAANHRWPRAFGTLFHAADWLAIHFQRRVLLAMRTLYTLAALMGIAFTVYDNLPAQDYMLFVFLLLFALGGLVVVLANRRGWHRKYLDYRALAEGLRVQSYWRRAGLSITGDAEFARDNFLQKQDVELGWIRNVMRGAALESALDTSTAKRRRTCATSSANGSATRHRADSSSTTSARRTQRARTHRITETIGVASLCVGIGISVVLAVFARAAVGRRQELLVVIMAVFSIVAGVREAYAYKKADKELIKQYRFMQRLFARGAHGARSGH